MLVLSDIIAGTSIPSVFNATILTCPAEVREAVKARGALPPQKSHHMFLVATFNTITTEGLYGAPLRLVIETVTTM